VRRQVVLYKRHSCSLCDHARAAIQFVQKRVEFDFREVDIGDDGELYDLYKWDIPVVEIDGRRAFKHRVDPEALLEKLA
jgi:glutaredoxin